MTNSTSFGEGYCATYEVRAKRRQKRNRLLGALALAAAFIVALPLAVGSASAGLDDGRFCVASAYEGEDITGQAGNCKPQTVAPPLAALSVSCESVGFSDEATARLSWAAVPGATYRVMARADLPGAEWELLDETESNAYEPDQGEVWYNHIQTNSWAADGRVRFAVDYSVDGKAAPRSNETNTRWPKWNLPEDIAECL